jgi:hypothetical protein
MLSSVCLELRAMSQVDEPSGSEYNYCYCYCYYETNRAHYLCVVLTREAAGGGTRDKLHSQALNILEVNSFHYILFITYKLYIFL